MSEQVSKKSNKTNPMLLGKNETPQPPTVQPLTRKAAMSEAVGAYIRCEELSPDERKRLIKFARVKTSLYRAIKLTFAFARGYIKDPWSSQNLRALTRAWLRLGERLFQLIYRFVRPRNSSVTPQGLNELLAAVPRMAVV